jgi:hypothetical protein
LNTTHNSQLSFVHVVKNDKLQPLVYHTLRSAVKQRFIVFFSLLKKCIIHRLCVKQGCQIFLGTNKPKSGKIYQNNRQIPQWK